MKPSRYRGFPSEQNNLHIFLYSEGGWLQMMISYQIFAKKIVFGTQNITIKNLTDFNSGSVISADLSY